MNERRIVLVVLSVLAVVFMNSCATMQPGRVSVKHHPETDVGDGWQLGIQTYTFNRFTFYDAVDKTSSLGLEWLEAYPGQSLSPEQPDVKFGDTMSPAIRRQVKQKLADSGVKLVTFGVVRLSSDEAQCRQVFDFAKDMGIKTLTAEPKEEAFDLVEKLCKEYKIKVAIHNHPQPSHYWSPDKVLEACRGRSKWIGACADTGHWMRSGLNPLECLKKLRGRIVSLHFKDLNEIGNRKAHDVVWGTGTADVRAILTELNRQKFEGFFAVEYEHNWDNSVPDIRKCVSYFNEVASDIRPTGWTELLDGGLSNWDYKPGGWVMENGVLTRTGISGNGGDIWTKETYGDFVLDLDFMTTVKTNSGIFFRTADTKDCVQTGIEVQVYDSYGRTAVTNHDCGAIYDCLAPSKNMAKKPGQWNRCTITCKANKIYVVMNGEQIIDMDLNKWTKPHKNPDGSKNKYNTAYKKMARVGHIGFQDHGHPVWYRNVKIKKLGGWF